MEKGLTVGVAEDRFAPYEQSNRAQIVTFLWRAAGSTAPAASSNPFSDVREGDFFYNAVLWAVENGITVGLTNTSFGASDACNRAQMVTFLYRAYE